VSAKEVLGSSLTLNLREPRRFGVNLAKEPSEEAGRALAVIFRESCFAWSEWAPMAAASERCWGDLEGTAETPVRRWPRPHELPGNAGGGLRFLCQRHRNDGVRQVKSHLWAGWP
jgi:hypothetical protein